MWYRPSWAINLLSAGLLKPTVTLGVGWGAYQGKPDVYTKLLLRKVLASDTLLSVRDEYTKQQLEIAGFDNVINTACLTMWGLTSEWCEGIVRNRASKAGAVVYTLTDYAIDYDLDFYSIKLLLDSYDEVYIWMQGSRDWSCFQEIVRRESAFFSKHKHAIKIVPPVLSCYDRLLESGCVDYVGTRLHGGIRALQKGVRTIIIGVDNRALEKKRDFKLPVVKRSEVESLREVIDSEYALEIELPLKNIERFKNSFGEFCQRHCTGSEFYIYR
jgi:polysaccharide pyruvyl transferase WcaK-like protein